MIRLADEEIQTIINNAPGPYDRYLAIPIPLLLEAQLKKVMNEIKKRLTKVSGNLAKPYRFINEDEWQALLEEVK